jgi:anti-sigma factor RsiW
VEQELIHDLVAAYALDALDDSERREFEEHLAGCEQCREELAGLHDAAEALAYVPEGPAPPPALRDRVLQRVHDQQASNVVPLRRRVALPAVATVAVVAAAAAIVLAVWASSLSSSLDTKNAALAVLSNTASKRMPLGTASQVVVAPDGRAVVVSGLSRAPNGKTYELWVLDGKSVQPAGLFTQGTRGTPVVLRRRVPKGAQVGLSLERSGGRTDHPTTIVGVSPPL